MADNKEDWLKRNGKYIPWICLVLLIAGAGSAQILLFASIQVIPDFMILVPGAFTALGSDAHGAVVQAAVTWAAGVLGLGTFFLNRDQKERHMQHQLEKDRNIAADQRRQEREISEYESLQREYDSLSQQFAQGEIMSRVNAVIGLATLAQRKDPRLPKNAQYSIDVFTSEVYPWFERAAMQLTAALHLYEEPEARAEVSKAIKVIASFDRGSDQVLLSFLLSSLAIVNRAAYLRFLNTLARGFAAGHSKSLDDYANSVSFFGSLEKDADLLRTLSKSQSFRRARRHFSIACSASKEKDDLGESHMYFSSLKTSADQLLSTRDSLLSCLSDDVRQEPSSMSMVPSGYASANLTSRDASGIVENISRKVFKGKGLLNLSSCFFAGAQFFQSQLRGINFNHANLTGSVFVFSQLGGSSLQGVRVSGAMFSECTLQCCNLRGAVFDGVIMPGSRFEGSNLQDTSFIDANLLGADFTACDLRNANLSGAIAYLAIFIESDLEFANLAGAFLGHGNFEPNEGDPLRPANFRNTKWKEADFRKMKNLPGTPVWALQPLPETDHESFNWLSDHFNYDDD